MNGEEMLSKRRKISTVLAAASLTAATGAAGLLFGAQPALAWDDANCGFRSGGPIYYWYHSYQDGAVNCQNGNVPDLASPGTYFNKTNQYADHPYDGLGDRLWNDAGSASNNDTTCAATIWYHASYTGSHLTLTRTGQAGWYSNTLGVVNNNNRSQNWSC
nr:hypothetical protein GCM10020092_056400 [Actinoplanes digitatis]